MATLRSYPDPAPQDPELGIDYGNVVPRLTAETWETKAVVRMHPAGWVSLWVTLYEEHRGDTRTIIGSGYEVRAVGNNGGYAQRYRQAFETLEAALTYSNGDAESRLAAETRERVPSDRFGELVGFPSL